MDHQFELRGILAIVSAAGHADDPHPVLLACKTKGRGMAGAVEQLRASLKICTRRTN
jgi:hypothetical protein